MRGKLLVIDDDEPSCRLVKAAFEPEGLQVVAAHDGKTGLVVAATENPDAVLLDLHLPDVGGLDVLEQLRHRAPALPVLMLTASREVKAAVRAMQLGAFDYLNKPIDVEELLLVVRRALQTRELQLEVEDLRRRVGQSDGEGLAAQMGSSPQIRQVIDAVALVAASDFTVLVQGETGTGKELVAQAIHRQSGRRKRPFVALDCGAIPENLLESELFGHERGAFSGADRRKHGQFQIADGGSCFLDEVGNLPTALQVKLLRVLESKQVQPVGAERATPIDVRFIAATNDDLKTQVQDRLFRADLYFRLAQYTISLPPLRERVDDIAYLGQRFLQEASVELRRPVLEFAPSALELLRGHRWPGNVRELRNVVRQAVLQSGEDLVIRPRVLQALLRLPGTAMVDSEPVGNRSLKQIVDEAARAAERQAISEVLRVTRGNKSQAAKVLKTDYKTLHVKMRLLRLNARDFGAP